MMLPPNTTEVTIDQLTPGSAYQVVVTSRSGELTNQSEVTARTGEILFFFFSFTLLISVLFLTLCLFFSSGGGVLPLAVLLVLWRTLPLLDASRGPLGELRAVPVRRLTAVSQHHSGPGGGELQLPWDETNAWEAVQSCAEGGERRTDGCEQL